MANIDLRKGAANGYPASGSKGLYALEALLDFEKDPRVATNVLELLDIPKGSMILGTKVEVIRAEGGTATAHLGLHDAAMSAVDADGFLASTDLNAAAGTVAVSKDGGAAYADTDVGVTAAHILTMTLGHDMDYGQYRIRAFVLG